MININYILKDCDCGQERMAVTDRVGEDVQLWEVYEVEAKINKPCPICGKLPKMSVSYAGDFVPGEDEL